jgi:acyl-CoA synthetase (AMP-forming)/AMP-acid ligase II/thioesterase domain-containing protein/acyl carrier protein
LSSRTILELIQTQTRLRPDAHAIEAIDHAPLTYRELLAQIERTGGALRGFGIGQNDRIAFVLPDGPVAAVAFLAIAASASAAPLNPAYRSTKLTFCLNDLPARAVVVPAGSGGEVADVARALGIDVIELVPRSDRAGTFDLIGVASRAPSHDTVDSTPDSVALLLHTSGTTARPKLVPLTHANLCTAAFDTATALELGPGDRCLHFVPMFHIHGLVGALLAPLAAGGSVVCTPGFQTGRILEWIDRFGPTWYTGVPTMHREILKVTLERRAMPVQSTLRFVRSVSASLPAQLLSELEHVIGVPVIQGYGMTEASPQIACNPLPPRVRKPGSVGLAAGPEVVILDQRDRPLGPCEVGEIAIRGANVMRGYDRNDEANAAAFVGGWFRTGDQGYRDEDGYLFLTGRLKEIINRGGEKITPLEIEEVLRLHPAVQEAVAFGVADMRLGESVAAAIILQPGAKISERELREFTADRLAFFKIPSQIVFVDELPKGPTGKLRRIGLAAELGLSHHRAFHSETRSDRPHTPIEQQIAELWQSTLGISDVGIHDNFFVLGGDSISVVDILSAVTNRYGIEVSPQSFFQQPTISGLVEKLESRMTPTAASPASHLIVPLQPKGQREALFGIHAGGDGSVSLYGPLAARLGTDQPFYGVQADGDWRGVERPYEPLCSIEQVAARYLDAICSIQPSGPYHLVGASFGGIVAFEMARQLRAQNESVASLFLFSSNVRNNSFATGPRGSANDLFKEARRYAAQRWPRAYRLAFAGSELRYQWRVWRGRRVTAAAVSARFLRESRLLINRYQPGVYDGQGVLFRSALGDDPLPLWNGLLRGGLDVHDMPGGHLDMLNEPTVDQVADLMRDCLERRRAAEWRLRAPILVAS